ncbi:MAG: YgfZ/GcvT domain-containing protein [Pseudomonadales bacterium]
MQPTAMIHQQWQTYMAAAPAERAAAGIAYLPDLAVARFAGADARAFLQGYLTCDTDELSAGYLTPTALCNLKGRVVINGWCVLADQDVLLLLHRSLVDELKTFLRAYLMFSKTKLVDQQDELLVLGGLDLPPTTAGLTLDTRRRLFLCERLDDARQLWETLPHLPDQAWLAALTADGIPLVSQPVSQAFLPQMLNLEALGAIDFTKGCYLGQEVVARAQHRGQVKRRLTHLTWSGTQPPEPGAEITDGRHRAVGTVVQSAAASAQSGPLLAVLQQGAEPPLRHGDSVLEPSI